MYRKHSSKSKKSESSHKHKKSKHRHQSKKYSSDEDDSDNSSMEPGSLGDSSEASDENVKEGKSKRHQKHREKHDDRHHHKRHHKKLQKKSKKHSKEKRAWKCQFVFSFRHWHWCEAYNVRCLTVANFTDRYQVKRQYNKLCVLIFRFSSLVVMPEAGVWRRLRLDSKVYWMTAHPLYVALSWWLLTICENYITVDVHNADTIKLYCHTVR